MREGVKYKDKGGGFSRRTVVWRSMLRSPHLFQLPMYYGIPIILMTLFQVYVYGVSFLRHCQITMYGLFFFTFIEYWFHRTVLHQLFAKIHANHHLLPQKFRILTTPVIMIYMVGNVSSLLCSVFFGRSVAIGILCGLGIGQMLMETSHILFHATTLFNCLDVARSYHFYHHYVSFKSKDIVGSDYAHGLTTPFWDIIFGTFPPGWRVARHKRWVRLLCLPFPLVGFFLIYLFSEHQSNQLAKKKSGKWTVSQFGPCSTHSLVMAFVQSFTSFMFFAIDFLFRFFLAC